MTLYMKIKKKSWKKHIYTLSIFEGCNIFSSDLYGCLFM
jgi:hypothetical protein